MQTTTQYHTPRTLVPGEFGEPHFAEVKMRDGHQVANGAFVPISELTLAELDEMEADMKLTERDFVNAMFLQRLKIAQRRFRIEAENETAAA